MSARKANNRNTAFYIFRPQGTIRDRFLAFTGGLCSHILFLESSGAQVLARAIMFGSKVFLTYKRKRQYLKNSFDHAHWHHNLISESACDTSLIAPDKHDKLTAEKTREKQKEKSMHDGDERRLCCSCVKQQESSSSLPVQKPGRLEVGEHGDYDATEMTVSIQKSFSTTNLCEDTSEWDIGELPPVEKSSQNGCHSQGNSYSFDGSGNGCNNCSDHRFISPSVELDTGNSFNLFSSEASAGRKFSSVCYDGSPIVKMSMEEFTDSLSKDKSRSLSSHMVTQTKSTGSLITFSRSYKRKKRMDGAESQSNLPCEEENVSLLTRCSMLSNGNASSCYTTSCERFSVDDLADFKQSAELSERGKLSYQTCDKTSCRSCSMDNLTDLNRSAEFSERGKVCQTRQTVKNADSPGIRGGTVSETGLTHMREQLHHREDITKTISPRAEQVPGQSSQIEEEAQHSPKDFQGASSNVDFRDPFPAATTTHEEPEKSQPCIRDASQNFLLTLSVNPAAEHNVDLDLSADRPPIHSRIKSLHDSLDSASRSPATAKDQVSQLDLLKPKNDRVGTLLSPHYTQLSEEKAIDGLHSRIVKSQTAACMMFDETKSLLQTKNLHPKHMPSSSLSLGLSSPMELKIGFCDSNDCFSVLPLSNSTIETRELFHDGLCQSSPNQRPLLLRHKIMLDNIVSRARALNERGSSQEKIKSHPTMWSEEELDFLWIGVRRYGRGNWDAMLRDPRLRFSPLRVPRDLADQWEDEQSKLLNDIGVPQFKYSKVESASMESNYCFLDPKVGLWGENRMDETQLSLGDVYAHRESNLSKRPHVGLNFPSNGSVHSQRPTSHSRRVSYDNNLGRYDVASSNFPGSLSLPRENSCTNAFPFNCLETKNNLPCWLREVVSAPPPKPVEPNLASAVSASSHSRMLGAKEHCFDVSKSCFLSQNRLNGLSTNELEISNGPHYSTYSRRKHRMVKMIKPLEHHVDKPDNLIIIDSDASSEETISDDRCARI